MSARRVTRFIVPLACAAAMFAACGGDEKRRGPPPASGGSGGTAATGGSAGVGGTAGAAGQDGGAGTAGAAGSGGTAGMAGAGGATGGTGGTGGTPAQCGNDVAETGEQCDKSDLAGRTCEKLGFTSGSLSCKPDCTLDTTKCIGKENCNDNIDNDGDSLVDCADSDCTAACADGCADPTVIGSPATLNGNTTGQAKKYDPSCKKPGSSSGSEVVYELTTTVAGVVEAKLTTNQPLLLSMRTTCTDGNSELGCSASAVKTQVTAGQKIFIMVDGIGPNDQGAFALEVENRAITCGDAKTDPGEECDDGFTANGDGCSSTCKLELAETEPNDTVAQATANAAYSSPWAAQISPTGDVDIVKVVVTDPGSSIIVDTFDFGDGACSDQKLDSFVEILGTNGTTVLASDDDGGVGLCAHAAVGGLAPGTYFVRIKAATDGLTPTFAYRLAITVDKCGNGNQVETEECDDGNNTAFDGCGPTCKKE